jgi:hypothetical protein
MQKILHYNYDEFLVSYILLLMDIKLEKVVELHTKNTGSRAERPLSEVISANFWPLDLG